MVAPLEPKLAELLVRLVEMDDGNYETFQPYFPGNGPLNEAILLNKREETIPEGPTKELADRGYIDMEPTTKRLGNFRISEQGRTLAAQLASVREGAVDLSWPTVEPILIQIHKLWLNEGAPPLGIPGSTVKANLSPAETADLSAVLHELQRDGWIEFRAGLGPPLPQGVRPTSKTISYVEGWPTDDARIAGEQFVTLLEERVEAEPDEEKRSKLRAALSTGGTALRDLSVEVAAAVVTRQVGG
jgi:hypothetical protein